MEQKSSGNNQQGQQIPSQKPEPLGNAEGTDEHALPLGSNLPPQPISNDPAVQTQGGAFIGGDITNEGGVNVLGGKVDTVKYIDKRRYYNIPTPSLSKGSARPNNYLPFPRNPLFQPRPGEFEELEGLLFASGIEPKRLGLVGMGGIGKTQLAVELAYRCLDQNRFPGGIFWMPATGTALSDWQRHLAEVAFNTNYLPSDDDPASSENEARRAQHFGRYLAEHQDALLILDNVEDPEFITYALPVLAGFAVACPVLYTSRLTTNSSGITTYAVEALPKEAALRLLLERTRPQVLIVALAGSLDPEAAAARAICQNVGYLPLVLVHLRGWLERDRQVTLVRLAEVLKARGALDLAKTERGDAAPLFATFAFSWEKIDDEEARRLFKLAAYFPEAAPIPLWLLGIAAGLGEQGDVFEPLGAARLELQELSLLERLSGEQVGLHPLVREFGQRLVAEELDQGQALRVKASERLVAAFTDLNMLEERARQGYWDFLVQARAVADYAGLLGVREAVERLEQVARWLDQESYLLGASGLWPKQLPALFYQLLYNRAVEEGQILRSGKPPVQWLRQIASSGAEDKALLHTLRGHSLYVRGVAFSPDGRYILTGSSDKTARLWEATSGRLLSTFDGHRGEVTSVAFSPDGRYILTGSSDKTARLWEATSGKLMISFEGHDGGVRSVAFSPEGHSILTGAEDRTARLWEATSGRLLSTFKGHDGEVMSVAFSPDGNSILTGSAGRLARLWEVSSGNLLVTFKARSGEQIVSVAFSPDGRYILTGSFEWNLRDVSAGTGLVRLWEVSSGKQLVTFQGHEKAVYSVTFSPDGRFVLTGSSDNSARLWEASSGKPLATLGHGWYVMSVAFSPDGRSILTGSFDGTARLWELSSVLSMTAVEGHSSHISCVTFSPDGHYILTGSYDKTACLWEVSSGKLLATLVGHTKRVLSVTFSPDGRFILTAAEDGTARLWEASSGKCLTTFGSQDGDLKSVAFSPNGRFVMIKPYDGNGQVWKMPKQPEEQDLYEQIATLEDNTRRGFGVVSAAFSPDSHYVAISANKQIGTDLTLTEGQLLMTQLWDVSTGKPMISFESPFTWEPGIVFSPDNRYLLIGSEDKAAQLWEIATGRLVARFDGHNEAVRCLAFSPDGRRVLTCDSSGQILLWDVKNLETPRLLSAYAIAYQVGAIYWRSDDQIVLADVHRSLGRSYIYQLQLEGF